VLWITFEPFMMVWLSSQKHSVKIQGYEVSKVLGGFWAGLNLEKNENFTSCGKDPTKYRII